MELIFFSKVEQKLDRKLSTISVIKWDEHRLFETQLWKIMLKKHRSDNTHNKIGYAFKKLAFNFSGKKYDVASKYFV